MNRKVAVMGCGGHGLVGLAVAEVMLRRGMSMEVLPPDLGKHGVELVHIIGETNVVPIEPPQRELLILPTNPFTPPETRLERRKRNRKVKFKNKKL